MMAWRERLYSRALGSAAQNQIPQGSLGQAIAADEGVAGAQHRRPGPPSAKAAQMATFSNLLANFDIRQFFEFGQSMEAVLVDFRARLDRQEVLLLEIRQKVTDLERQVIEP